MPSSWSPQRERQYEHILDSCLERRPLALCKRVAAATVNKTRALKGESKTVGCHCPRGTKPLRNATSRCYDPATHRRVARRCAAPKRGQTTR